VKVRQIRGNPKIEFCLLFEGGEHHGYIRGAGLAKIIKDRETKVKLANTGKVLPIQITLYEN